MIAEIGIIATGLAFVAAAYAIVAALVGMSARRDALVTSARNAAIATFPLLTVSCGLLVYAMLDHDYSIAYVWQTTDNNTPAFYLVTGLWGSQAGSLLFWSWLMSGFTFAALLLNWRSERRLMPVVIAVTMATLGFFLILNNFIENPFERYWVTPETGRIQPALFAPDGAEVFHPADGNGLNPLLRHLGMVIHPPMLYLGFVGFTIPFAFAFAALATGQLGSGWLRATRRWALVAWLFLSLGLLLGGRWAYDVLGWGGYWGWDPVENAALLPWLTGTAFLHSAVVQEKRGMLKFWNMLLIITTFLLVVLGTFATRSGVVSSVHSFAESEIGLPMFTFLGLSMLVSVALLAWRQERGDLRGADELDSVFSRESFFLLNNWMFLGLTVVVLWGSWAEAITTILVDLGLRDTIINLGPDYYPPVVRPFLVGIFILMGIAPLAAWRRTTAERLGRSLIVPTALAIALMAYLVATDTDSPWALLGYGLVTFAGAATLVEIWKGMAARHRRGENYLAALLALVRRDRRRYGGYFIHLGMVVMGIGIIGSSGFQKTTMQTLNVGERLALGHYELQHNGLYEAQAEDGRTMIVARMSVYKDGELVANVRPRRDIFMTTDPATGMPAPGTNMSIPGNYSTVAEDFYAIITHWTGNTVTFRAYLNPLISFVWMGGIVLILGTMVALWPSRQPDAVARKLAVPPESVGARAGGGD
ncbi:MAG: heme lyase CcmF/NrfE family subunit [Chloroflexi bacterium]|nr:heme lyase CcmF/NrfE family subunit [Chloroflexota bacterium]